MCTADGTAGLGLVANLKPVWSAAARRPAAAAERADVKATPPAARAVQPAPWAAQSADCPGWRAGSSGPQSAAGPTEGRDPGPRAIDAVTDAAGADVAATASADAAVPADDKAAFAGPTPTRMSGLRWEVVISPAPYICRTAKLKNGDSFPCSVIRGK